MFYAYVLIIVELNSSVLSELHFYFSSLFLSISAIFLLFYLYIINIY